MKLKKLEKPEDALERYSEDEIIIQHKYDGFKTQAIKNGNEVKLFTRRGEDFTENVPSLASDLAKKMKDGDFILGELAYIKEGKQSISDIQTIVGSNPEKAHEVQKDTSGSIIFYVYDLLWNGGKDITKSPYIDRYNGLKSKIGSSKNIVELVKNYEWKDLQKALDNSIKSGGEGVVLKSKDSTYEYGSKGAAEKTGDWYKFKPGEKAKEADVIVKEYNKGKTKLIFPAYQYKDGKLFEVGQVSGLPKEEEATVKAKIDAGKMVVLEVGYQEVYESGKLRHIGFKRIRDDKPIKEVKMASAQRPISIRHAQAQSVVEMIKQNPQIQSQIDSFFEHSGGTKSITTVLDFLRNNLKDVYVSYSDHDLLEYLKERKQHFRQNKGDDRVDIGLVGVDPNEDPGDFAADYITHGKK
jgi:ATP-dependent DNA ligase